MDGALDSSSGAATTTTLRSASIEAHKGAVSGIAVYLDNPGIVATWSDASGVSKRVAVIGVCGDRRIAATNYQSLQNCHLPGTG